METQDVWLREEPGPATLSQVMDEFEALARRGELGQFQPLPTGFMPLDDVLNGGIRPGELAILAGPFGVGKTILALQLARNAVLADPNNKALYVCYEHDRTHLLSRLICLESAEHSNGEDSLTLRKLSKLAFSPLEAGGLIDRLRQDRRYTRLLADMADYADRLVLARASGAYTTLQDIGRWVDDLRTPGTQHVMLVVDYLQKVPLGHEHFVDEAERTTMLTQDLKEMALSKGIVVVAVAAADRLGLKEPRMRLADLRGSSALQYETDLGMVLNNKHDIVSREHLVYNLADAEAMRGWVVLSIEKNRAGRNAVDMEYAMDAAHFRIVPEGTFVRERLIDGKAVLE
ncbi:MAG: AAA family ATPase [Anaerolineae bacterium]|nr:AAA family ATPase [Anaerolineae bacterium]